MYTEEFLKKIQMFGMLKYEASRIFILVSKDDINQEQFKKDFEDVESQIFKSYQYGLVNGEYAVDASLFKSAKDGDIDAINKIEELRENSQYKELCKEIFG